MEEVFTAVIFLIIRKIDLVVTTLLWKDGKSMWRVDEVVVKGRYWGFWKEDNVGMMKIKFLV